MPDSKNSADIFQGVSASRSFETLSQNLATYPKTYIYDAHGRIHRVDAVPAPDTLIKKEFKYGESNGLLEEISLSGDLPIWLEHTTKTIQYDNYGNLESIGYS